MTWAAWGNPKRQTVTALRVRTSTREREVLDLLAEGANNRQIARSLGVSLKTVQNHVSRILDKLQAADRTQAALRAKGLLPPPH
jgi:DNA-binding NarL/FixJ family response regulator